MNSLVPRCPQSFLIRRESELRGWLLLNLLTGYFLPSKTLMPYATKFLQLAGSDPSSTHHGKTVSCKVNMPDLIPPSCHSSLLDTAIVWSVLAGGR